MDTVNPVFPVAASNSILQGGVSLLILTTCHYVLILGAELYFYQHDMARRSRDITLILHLIHSRMCNAQYWSYARDVCFDSAYLNAHQMIHQSSHHRWFLNIILILNLVTWLSTMNN